MQDRTHKYTGIPHYDNKSGKASNTKIKRSFNPFEFSELF